MRIAQVSAAQTAGGAERVAMDLHACFREAGHDAVLLTPRVDPEAPQAGVIQIDVDAGCGPVRRGLSRVDRRLARPVAAWRRRKGYDDFAFPWTAGLLDLLPWTPDVLHLHNLHGGWFGLRQLAPLSQRVPTVVTLHDAGLLTGGPHVFCMQDRWNQEALRENRKRRAAIFAESSLHIVTPSRWMHGHLAGSALARGVSSSRVIPNGIDLDVFSPGDSGGGRTMMGVPGHAKVLLGVGLTGRGTPSHTDPGGLLCDPQGLSADAKPLAVRLVGGGEALSGVLGLEGGVDFKILGRVDEPRSMAELYRAADVLTHYVFEDNFPSVVLEAMACGLPVFAPGVGGIPEQFEDGVHGRLFEGGHDARSRQALLWDLLDRPAELAAMGEAGAEHARKCFDRRRMAADYLGFYGEVQG